MITNKRIDSENRKPRFNYSKEFLNEFYKRLLAYSGILNRFGEPKADNNNIELFLNEAEYLLMFVRDYFDGQLDALSEFQIVKDLIRDEVEKHVAQIKNT